MSKELQFLIYNTPQEDIKVNVVIRDETIWLTQKAMAKLFDTSSDNISLHLKNIYNDRELEETATTENFSVVQSEGNREVKRKLKFYSLDAIISVGYRVNSTKATQFRIWATKTLKEFIQKGFVIDDERLKQGETVFGKDYFRELLDRVRSIRASERRIWQQITDIFAECSFDYDKDSNVTKDFYAMVQNKFHYAITGQTAAEIIHSKADKAQEMTLWQIPLLRRGGRRSGRDHSPPSEGWTQERARLFPSFGGVDARASGVIPLLRRGGRRSERGYSPPSEGWTQERAGLFPSFGGVDARASGVIPLLRRGGRKSERGYSPPSEGCPLGRGGHLKEKQPSDQ